MLDVKETWTVDKKTYGDLEYPFYIAIRTHDGKTYQSAGFKRLERADTVMFKIMDSGQASERAFVESCPYGVDRLND
jgi:hypothetical protein